MIKNLLLSIASCLLIISAALPVLSTSVSAQIDCSGFTGTDRAKCESCSGAGGTSFDGDCQRAGERTLTTILRTITNILTFIVGAVAVIMLIIGGLRYVLSGGDQQGVEGAKNTILYAVVGIVVAFMAYAIARFVIGALD